MNSYRTSQGDRLTKSKIDRNTRKAKEIKKGNWLKYRTFFYCETCGQTEHSHIIDNSHIISVKYAQETGRTELAWDQDNIIYQCRKCHIELENKGNIEREKIYNQRKK